MMNTTHACCVTMYSHVKDCVMPDCQPPTAVNGLVKAAGDAGFSDNTTSCDGAAVDLFALGTFPPPGTGTGWCTGDQEYRWFDATGTTPLTGSAWSTPGPPSRRISAPRPMPTCPCTVPEAWSSPSGR